jgi:hypothetical protein
MALWPRSDRECDHNRRRCEVLRESTQFLHARHDDIGYVSAVPVNQNGAPAATYCYLHLPQLAALAPSYQAYPTPFISTSPQNI